MKPTRPPARLYWWHHPNGLTNLGDLLSSIILEKYTGYKSEWTDPLLADVVCVGSVLDVLPREGWPGIVAGAGQLHEDTRTDLRHATVLGVRGPMTAKRITASKHGHIAIGDPVLLASELVARPKHHRHEVGVVPHWSDTVLYEREVERAVRGKYPKPLFIDVTKDPLTVVKQIASCNKIVASSLHGLVVADSFGIPRRAEAFPNLNSRAEGGGPFKFSDYNQSVGTESGFGFLQQVSHTRVERMIEELVDMFIDLKGILDRA